MRIQINAKKEKMSGNHENYLSKEMLDINFKQRSNSGIRDNGFQLPIF